MAADNRGPELAAIVISLLVFSCITVGLRCYTMGIMMKRFFAEDWIAVATLAFYIAYSVFALVSIHFGLGQHVVDVPAKEHPKALLFKWLGQVFYVVIAVQVKFIVGLFLLRICSHKKWQRVTIYTLLTIITLFNAFYIFIVILQCIPVEFYWFRYTFNSSVHGKCNKSKLAVIPTYINLMLNVLSDCTLAALPVSFVWNSKMEIKTKISVVGVLALGSIACLATIARIPYAKQLLSNPDYLYNFTDLAIWSTVEIGLGLSASSLATLKPLFRKLKILASTRKTERSVSKTIPPSSSGHSRKMSAISMRFGSNSRIFTPIEEEASAEWPMTPGEKTGDVEMGNMISPGSRIREKGMDISVRENRKEGDGVEKADDEVNLFPRRPPSVHRRETFFDD